MPRPEYDEWGGPELHGLDDRLSTPPSRELAVTEDWWRLRAIESLYDSCIRQADAAIERLVSSYETGLTSKIRCR